jgi:hypothetical protein
MWQHAWRIMTSWTKETAMEEALRPKPAGTGPDRREQPRDAIGEPARPTRPPTPEDFIRDLRESDPLRRFRF